MRLDPRAGDPLANRGAVAPGFSYAVEAPGPARPHDPEAGDLRLWDELDALEARGGGDTAAEAAGVAEVAVDAETAEIEAESDWQVLRLWEDGGEPEAGPEVVDPSRRRWHGLRRRPRRVRRRIWRNVRRGVLLVALLVFALVARSVGGALTAPGSDSAQARLAMWARDHGGTPVVNFFERATYKAPKVGGMPTQAIPVSQAATPPSTAPTPTSTAPSTVPAPAVTVAVDPSRSEWSERFPDIPPIALTPPKPKGPVTLPLPAPIPPVASPALADEGVWQTLRTVKGKPALMATYLRADSTYTSYLSAVAWMDTKLLGFEHHPGTTEPGGGPWSMGASLPADERADVVAAFNSGFRMGDSRGGFYLDGRTAGTMRDGAATIGFYADGSVKLGQWGRDVEMSPNLAGARQNLDLIVDDSQVNPRINDNSGYRWGATIGNELYVWRTGIGITATGALVFAAGPRLSAATLADLLIRAGAVRAMQLDINASWTIFVNYDESGPNKLLATMQRPATVYNQTNSRDFIVARAKP